MDSSLEMWLWLLLVMQPHNPRTYKILEACGYDIRSACVAVRDGGFSFLSAKEKKRAADVRMKEIRDLQRLCADNNICIVPLDSSEYPEKLRLISNPPIVLFVQGNILCLKNRLIVSAVGTRRPSEYSVRVSGELAGQLASAGAAVVSGLAVGLDTAAHRGALNANGITVGVLACGSLVNYPAESGELKKEIVRKGGAVIGELMPESPCPNGYFPMRNRIMAGIADATVVLEAAAKSGTLLTANHAFGMRRRVFVIPPHDIFDPRYAGLTGLYRNGAAPVFGVEDILNSFTSDRADNELVIPPGPARSPSKNAVTAGSPAIGSSDPVTAIDFRSGRTAQNTQPAQRAQAAQSGRTAQPAQPARPAQSAQPAQTARTAQPAQTARSYQHGDHFVPKPPTEEELRRTSPEGKLAVKYFSSTDRYVPYPEEERQKYTERRARSRDPKARFKVPPQMMPGLDYSILLLLAERDMTLEQMMNYYQKTHTYEEFSDSLICLEMDGYIARKSDGSYRRL